MPRDNSPRSRPSHSDSYSDKRRRYDDDDRRSSRRDSRDRERGGAGSSSSYRRDRDERGATTRRDNREQSYGGYGYGEEERERERRRDRERYDRRRSASPRRRSSSRSKSPKDLAKPKFTPSGLLAAETNTVQSVDGKNSTVLKYNEPPEARKPVEGWRLYVFKSQGQAQSGKEEEVEILHIQRQSAYLIGRDRLVADIPVEHPSCSKQHAVIQYRLVQQKDEYGGSKGVVKPFIIDLNSTNGTHVNGEQIPTSRYYEVMVNDVIKFGTSNREYVLLHDGAAS